MRCMIFIVITRLAFCAMPAFALPNTARISVCAVDDVSGKPVPNASVKVWFDVDIGWRAWSEPTPIVTDEGMTDGHGLVRLTGETNTGHLSCRGWKDGSYYRAHASQQYGSKSLLGVWQPDDLVVTLRLQRVERPIPLMVKRVEWRNWKSGLRGLQETNAVMRFDLVRGDWLPPYGQGERPDLEVASELRVTGKERRYRHSTRAMGNVVFYDLIQAIGPADAADCLSKLHSNHSLGIPIRKGDDRGVGGRVVRCLGKRKRTELTGNWECEYTKDYDPDRCYTFRIRTRRDGDGNLVEAYYGKVYGDFMLSGDLERGMTEISFLYYLNPMPLDRNLEWDMRNNLCPDPGSLGERRP